MIVNGRGFDPPILQKVLSRSFVFCFVLSFCSFLVIISQENLVSLCASCSFTHPLDPDVWAELSLIDTKFRRPSGSPSSLMDIVIPLITLVPITCPLRIARRCRFHDREMLRSLTRIESLYPYPSENLDPATVLEQFGRATSIIQLRSFSYLFL